jgi:hypothetical protein
MELVNELIEAKAIIGSYLNELKNPQGWTKFLEEPNRKISFKREKGYKFIT